MIIMMKWHGVKRGWQNQLSPWLAKQCHPTQINDHQENKDPLVIVVSSDSKILSFKWILNFIPRNLYYWEETFIKGNKWKVKDSQGILGIWFYRIKDGNSFLFYNQPSLWSVSSFPRISLEFIIFWAFFFSKTQGIHVWRIWVRVFFHVPWEGQIW